MPARVADDAADAHDGAHLPPGAKPRAGAGGAGADVGAVGGVGAGAGAAGGAAWLREQAAALQREGEAVRSAALVGSAAAAVFSISPAWLRG